MGMGLVRKAKDDVGEKPHKGKECDVDFFRQNAHCLNLEHVRGQLVDR